MNADLVSYRYTRDELSTLLLILDLPPFPGVQLPPIDEAAYRAAVDSLADSGLVTPAGDRAIVDQLTALLLLSIAKSRFHFRFDAPDRAIALWRCPLLCVMGVFPLQGECSLTPVPSLAGCDAALSGALTRCGFPISVASPLLDGETLSASNAEELTAVKARLLHLASAVESETA
ncbi:MAG: hypothetical protein J5998_09505 [Clostridia bacterium]|nr:hypothetical protein [Clostridia bacterium]